MKNFNWLIFLGILSPSLLFGVGLSFLQPGAWWISFLSSFFILALFFMFAIFVSGRVNIGRNFARMLFLAFLVRLLSGVFLFTYLPFLGYNDVDDRAGYVFTDAHRRDEQAWELAASDRPIMDAFQENFAYDQYGGLLAFSALAYRYLSPDVHRPLLLILISAVVAALGIPFLWKAVEKTFGEKIAWAAAWIFALYPESVLLGSSAMREPYIMTFSAMAFWGFIQWRDVSGSEPPQAKNAGRLNPLYTAWLWLGIGLLGMILVSPSVALFTLVIFAGWISFSREKATISWKAVLVFAVIFVAGLFFLSASLNRSGEFDSTSPLHVINDWLKLAVKWDAYQLGRESGWVQKLFEEMPSWMRLPFVMFYGVLRPVLPATLIDPTTPVWKLIYISRGLGWYALLPMLILSFIAGTGEGLGKKRPLWMWISLLAWTWILLASLRGGGDDWDNPRYRALAFLWQALMGGYVWVWWRETRNAWFLRVLACEAVFLLVFTQWYASRYLGWGVKLEFAPMVGLILLAWVLIVGIGVWRDKRHA